MKVIRPALLEGIVRRLVDEFHPDAIYLFGSRAWGKPSKASDLDLLAIVATSKEKPIQRAIRAQRSLRGVKAAVDVLVKTRREFDRCTPVKASREAQITREGKLLYGRKAHSGAKLA
jgi:predicted nucleotidyltransferase